MGIRDMANEAADLAAAEKAAQKRREAEAWKRLTHDECYAWCTEVLLPPDEVIPEPQSSYMNDRVARVRIDDVWLHWHSAPDSYTKVNPPAAQLIHQIRIVPKAGDKLAPDHPNRIQWRTILDNRSYWIRSMADLGDQLKRAETAAKLPHGFELVLNNNT